MILVPERAARWLARSWKLVFITTRQTTLLINFIDSRVRDKVIQLVAARVALGSGGQLLSYLLEIYAFADFDCASLGGGEHTCDQVLTLHILHTLTEHLVALTSAFLFVCLKHVLLDPQLL